jgi:predicted amidohydrolase
MRVALAQMNSVPDLNLNIKNIQDNIKAAKNDGADFILFPENCGFMGKGVEMLSNAFEESSHPVLIAAREAANKHGIFVLLGSIAVFPSKANRSKLANRSLFIDRQGNICGRYDKINMFDANISARESYNESHRYIAGSEIVAVENELGKIGLTICYDIRSPELYIKLSSLGCNIITIPSAFTVNTGKFHWEVLLRARAIETSCWILAPAQIGIHYNNRETWGHSMVIDPWGNKIVEAQNKQQLIYAEVDVNKSKEIKSIWGKK